MLKLVIFGCLCTVLLVKAEGGPQPPSVPPTPGDLPKQIENNRVVRQAMPQQQSGMPSMSNMPGVGTGNFGMQGLGNLPDPTAIIAKGQEIGRQFLGGRRRRQVPTTIPPLP